MQPRLTLIALLGLLAGCAGPAPKSAETAPGPAHAPTGPRQGYYVAAGDGEKSPARLFVYSAEPEHSATP